LISPSGCCELKDGECRRASTGLSSTRLIRECRPSPGRSGSMKPDLRQCEVIFVSSFGDWQFECLETSQNLISNTTLKCQKKCQKPQPFSRKSTSVNDFHRPDDVPGQVARKLLSKATLSSSTCPNHTRCCSMLAIISQLQRFVLSNPIN
jgi:hypothetical protein